jgi:FkbM family methyltransferase
MIIGVSIYGNVRSIFAFEPRKECVDALKKTIQLNGENRIRVYHNLCSDKEENIDLHLNKGGTSAGIYNTDGDTVQSVQSVKLDNVLPEQLDNAIILVDVEGAEPFVLRGGKEFIHKNLPLIIFEYNNTSKQYFNLDDIADITGERYSFWRLKSDGSLDKDFSNSWNVVAIPQDRIFERILL